MKQPEPPLDPELLFKPKPIGEQRPLMPHESEMWNKINWWLKHRQGWDYNQCNRLKYHLSNEPDGFKRFLYHVIQNPISLY